MQDCKHVSPEKGRLVNCLVEHREHAKDQKCRGFLHKMASIVYGDYRLIYGFYQACKSSVVKHNCGKIQTKNENVSTLAFSKLVILFSMLIINIVIIRQIV